MEGERKAIYVYSKILWFGESSKVSTCRGGVDGQSVVIRTQHALSGRWAAGTGLRGKHADSGKAN